MAPSFSQGREHKHEGPDLFTKLCIKACATDVGDRPIPCPGWLSPSITFVPDPPLEVGKPAKVRVLVNNFGTMDATNVLLEVAYNIWLGNQPEANEPIANLSLPMIPSRGSHLAELDWTPPDTDAVHACVHARVFDTYSLANFSARCLNWDSLVNPQAGNKNLSLVRIDDAAQPLVFVYKAMNRLPETIQARILLVPFSTRAPMEERWARSPLPILLEQLPDSLRESWGREAEHGDTKNPRFGLWPDAETPRDLVHDRFGFADPQTLGLKGDRRGQVKVDARRVKEAKRLSLWDLKLEPGREVAVAVVIPPEELPERGRRRVFQLNYQEGRGLPIRHYLFVHH